MLPAAPRDFKETIAWRQRLRGNVESDPKTQAYLLAIGGLRNAAESVNRLHTVKSFGKQLGDELRAILLSNFSEGTPEVSWIHLTCDLIGTTSVDPRPPLAAIEAVKSHLITRLGGDGTDTSSLTLINSKLLGCCW